MNKKFIDLTGQMVGRWLVLKRVENSIRKDGKPQIMWLCQCQCEKKTERTISSKNLLGKNTLSCGCYHKDRMKEIGKTKRNPNHYDLTQDYGIGYTAKNEPFYFDLEDYDLIKEYRWYREIRGGYITTVANGKHIKMHQLLTNEKYIDHIDRCTNNNRKSNLRIADRSKNEMNKGCSIRNTSGVVGVCYSKSKNKWIAQIRKGNINRNKSFSNKTDAIIQRLLWEKELFGEYSGQRDLWKEYKIE